MAQEVEIKLPVRDIRALRALLRKAGFRVSRRRVFEINTVFDTAAETLRESGRLLRIRTAGRRTTLTYKGPPLPGKHKSREELELELPAARPMAEIFDRLGFRPVFRYEKYRTEFSEQGRGGTAELDETPIGVFLELEGPGPWIDRTARRLGYSQAGYITKSYGGLYLEWCKAHQCKPRDMVFTR